MAFAFDAPIPPSGAASFIRWQELEVPMLIPTRQVRRARLAPLAAATFLLVAAPPAQAQEHTLHVAVADAQGNPVPGLGEDDIVVQWDGENLETTEFEALDWPVRLTVFVDNSSAAVPLVPQLREGLRALFQALPTDMEIAVLTTARQPRWITRHTTDRAELEGNIANISPDPGTAPTYNDALVEEANRLDDDDDREYYPVIIMVAADGADLSRSQQGRIDQMVERMIENAAEVHTLLYVTGAFGSGAMAAGVGERMAQITRGSFERITVPTVLVERLEALGRDIARKHRFVSNQYRITYRQPRNASSQPAIGVATRREGLQMMATLDGNIPSRMPQQ